jgi:hypothetical protein
MDSEMASRYTRLASRGKRERERRSGEVGREGARPFRDHFIARAHARAQRLELINARARTHTRTHTCTHTCGAHTHARARMHTQTQTRTHALAPTGTRAHTRTRTHRAAISENLGFGGHNAAVLFRKM